MLRFQTELREHLRTEGSIYQEIRETQQFPDELQEKLRAEIEKFGKTFSVKETAAVT